MSVSFDFSDWPPELSKNQSEALTLQASTAALGNGLLYLPLAEQQPNIFSAAIHAPFSLFPSPFPRKLFDKARRMQNAYNILYAHIAMDNGFLDSVMGAEEGLGKVDDFIGQLWRGWKKLRDDGLIQPLHLGIFRSDCLLHAQPGGDLSIKQVEFNTISVSFGCLSQKVAALHRYLLQATSYYQTSSSLKLENLPSNENITGLASGLAEAHKAYGVTEAQILFVIQPGKRNVFDQRRLEYQLLEGYSIKVIRQTLDQLAEFSSVDPSSSILRIACSSDIEPSGFVEISTVYYRSGYMPHEYPTSAHYTTRFLLERSKAIKCPTIALQLAGGKKVQQVLTQPGVLERFLMDETRYGSSVVPREDVQELRDSFMSMWGLDVSDDMLSPDTGGADGSKEHYGVRKAREEALSLVLKPQREGGGNNVYKESIPPFLDSLPPQERQAWTTMELIHPPETGNYLVRAGTTQAKVQVPVKAQTISELGIYGWALFGGLEKQVTEREVGWLLRTKGKDSEEGGVATGFSVLDSLLLVD